MNREGAHFCQDCGKAIDGAAGGVVAAASGPAAAASGPAASPASALPSAPVSAPVAAPPAVPAVPSGVLPGALPPIGALPEPPRREGRAGPSSSAITTGPGSGVGRVTCSQCGQPTPGGFTFCQHCGARILIEASPRREARSGPKDAPSSDVPSTGSGRAHAEPPRAPARAGGSLHGRLIVLRRDGSDGEEVPLAGETFDIGRAASGGKSFPDDPFLAARHARFLAYAGGVRVRPIDTVNGVFIQIRDPHELQPGDVFYIGRELIRFEPLAPEERDPPAAVELGVRVFGSTPRESWGRLRQLTSAALVRDVWHLSRAEVLLGREEGDIVFPDDEFMSRRHALVSRVGGRVRLEDQHSSNGTYVRLRGDRDVQPNDVLRIGDQVLRYEP
ncbi:MAG: FHA domain-containing protein [Polyangia bacterium]